VKNPKGIGPINPPAAISTLPFPPENEEMIMNMNPIKINANPIVNRDTTFLFFFIFTLHGH